MPTSAIGILAHDTMGHGTQTRRVPGTFGAARRTGAVIVSSARLDHSPRDTAMATQKAIQISAAKTADSKELAAQLAGKQTAGKRQSWTRTFAASGSKTGGKAVN